MICINIYKPHSTKQFMPDERVLVLIKPDAMQKQLAGNIIAEIYLLKLKMIGLKLVNVKRELAELHYQEHKLKLFYKELIDYITGGLHEKENVIAIAYKGENAVQKLREYAGKTNPELAHPTSLRGRYGRILSTNKQMDNVVHVSDSPEKGGSEIKLWFKPEELVE